MGIVISKCYKCKADVEKEQWCEEHWGEVEYKYECKHCGYYEHWAYGYYVERGGNNGEKEMDT